LALEHERELDADSRMKWPTRRAQCERVTDIPELYANIFTSELDDRQTNR